MSLASTFFQFLASNAVTEVTGSVGRHRIIYLTVEMRNRSKDGGRYAQDPYRNGDCWDCDGHYGMGTVVSGKHNPGAGRRKRRADAHASPVVKSRVVELTDRQRLWPGHIASLVRCSGPQGPR